VNAVAVFLSAGYCVRALALRDGGLRDVAGEGGLLVVAAARMIPPRS
jgi:hypothetical protein